MKVMTVVGTRPEIIRLARVIDRLDATEGIEHVLVHTGQNYDYSLNQVFFDDLRLRAPDFVAQMDRAFAEGVRRQGFDVSLDKPAAPMFQPLRLRERCGREVR